MGEDYEIWAYTPPPNPTLPPSVRCEPYEKGARPAPDASSSQTERDRFEECATTRNFGYDYEINKGYDPIYLSDCSIYSQRTKENCLQISKQRDELWNAKQMDKENIKNGGLSAMKYFFLSVAGTYAVLLVASVIMGGFSSVGIVANGKGSAPGIPPGPLNPNDFML